MYEKVIIVGVELIPRSPSGFSTSTGMLRVYSYTAEGNARNWDYYIAAISEGEKQADRRREFMIDSMPTGTIYHLLGAAGIMGNEYEDLYASIQSGNYDQSFAIERQMESRAMQICRAVGQATNGDTEYEIAQDVLNLLVGRIVRIDWEQRGRFGSLAPHALQVLPSRDNGSDVFGSRSKDEWIKLHRDEMRMWKRRTSDREQMMQLALQLKSKGIGVARK